jgi:hypothetical protein
MDASKRSRGDESPRGKGTAETVPAAGKHASFVEQRLLDIQQASLYTSEHSDYEVSDPLFCLEIVLLREREAKL